MSGSLRAGSRAGDAPKPPTPNTAGVLSATGQALRLFCRSLDQWALAQALFLLNQDLILAWRERYPIYHSNPLAYVPLIYHTLRMVFAGFVAVPTCVYGVL